MHDGGAIAIRLSDLMNSGESKTKQTRPTDEAQIMTLQEFAAVYAQPCRFKAGDIVTARPGCNNTGAGNPHIVLEVLKTPHSTMELYDVRAAGSAGFGWRVDMRVMSFETGRDTHPGVYTAFWVESYIFLSWDEYQRDYKDREPANGK